MIYYYNNSIQEERREGEMRVLDELERRVVGELKKIKDPETGSDIVSMGFVYGITIEENSVEVWVNFSRGMPGCFFCKVIAWNLIERISKDIVKGLSDAGFRRVRVLESANPELVYKEEGF